MEEDNQFGGKENSKDASQLSQMERKQASASQGAGILEHSVLDSHERKEKSKCSVHAKGLCPRNALNISEPTQGRNRIVVWIVGKTLLIKTPAFKIPEGVEPPEI